MSISHLWGLSDASRQQPPAKRRPNANHPKIWAVSLLGLFGPLAAANTPWLPVPDSGDFSASFVRQNADEFWHCDPAASGCPQGGVTKTATPGGGEELSQNTLWLNVSYGISDSIALDAQLGWAETSYPGPGPKRMGTDSLNGIADFNASLRWRISDEVTNNRPSVALRLGVILAGNYDTGYINSVGDGGDGIEGSIIVGKFITERLGVSGELGYRKRNDGIPSETFVNVIGLVTVNNAVALGIDYRRVNADGSIEIGGPGFSPPRFPQVEEDASVLAGRMFWQIDDSLNLSLLYGKTIDGRNTAAADIFGVTLSHSFSRY